MRRYEDPDLCRSLRTKSMYIIEERQESDVRVDPGTAAYWCLKTMAPIGPDDCRAHVEGCRAHRACYEAGPPV
ncbi:MAG: hypothetical protein U1E76_16995 [Planctomycetota bacterium]